MSNLPPPGCWSCGREPSDEDIVVRSLLHPRTERNGGPVTILRCPGCTVETVVDEMPDGSVVLSTRESAGLGNGRAAALLEGAEGRRILQKARDWTERWQSALDAVRSTRRARRRTDSMPPPPRPNPRRRTAPPPPPPPEAPPPRSNDLPATPAQARAVLGVTRDSSDREVDKAYREQSRKCHPDLVAHLDKDFQELAHAKFLRLQRAHEILKKGRKR
ncbi:MAG: J domain-containing protein [Planctomycetota bacterium]